MENLPLVFQNPFLTNTEGSYEKFYALTDYHDDVVKAHDFDAFYAARYAFYHPFHLAFVDKYNVWNSSRDTQEGNTLQVKQLLADLSNTLIEDWDVRL